VWKKSKGKYYYYILQHCPPELKTGLKTWLAVKQHRQAQMPYHY
jgi:hypothetical protein